MSTAILLLLAGNDDVNLSSFPLHSPTSKTLCRMTCRTPTWSWTHLNLMAEAPWWTPATAPVTPAVPRVPCARCLKGVMLKAAHSLFVKRFSYSWQNLLWDRKCQIESRFGRVTFSFKWMNLSDSFCSCVLEESLVSNVRNFPKHSRALMYHQCPFNSNNSGINCGCRRSFEEMPQSFKSSQSEQINIHTPQSLQSSPPWLLWHLSRHVTNF